MEQTFDTSSWTQYQKDMKYLIPFIAGLVFLLTPASSFAMVRPVFSLIDIGLNTTTTKNFGFELGAANTTASSGVVAVPGTIQNLYISLSNLS